MRAFVPWPDPRLRKPAAPVTEITDEIRAIWDEMVAAMRAMPGRGIGLAAVQLGIPLRLAVVDAGDGSRALVKMANPRVIAAAPQMTEAVEASPNLPGIEATIARPEAVSIGYMDAAGITVRADLEGLWARSALHQIDHLEGRLFVDRLSRVRRDMLLRKARKGRD